MANQQSNPFGEINTIRDILMGEQMGEYEVRFKELQEKLVHAQSAIEEKIAVLEQKQSEAMAQLREEVFLRLKELDQLLAEKSTTLEQKIDSVSSSDRNHIGKLLKELGQQLTENTK